MTWRPAEISVVGFCGLPISAATAMVAPVFESPAGRYFTGDPDSVVPPRTFMDREELERNREAGYLTLTNNNWRRQPGAVVLYAHPTFLNPGATLCELSAAELNFDTRANVFLDYLARANALTVLYRWGRSLVEEAGRILSSRPETADLDRAMDAAERALFCAPPPEHKQLRIDSFIALVASHHVRKHPTERLYREMKLDFDDATIAEIRRRSEAKAAGVRPYPDELPQGVSSARSGSDSIVENSQDAALWMSLTSGQRSELAMIVDGKLTSGIVLDLAEESSQLT